MVRAMIKNILIDLDGTLTDPKVGITASARYGLEKVGHPIAENINIDWIIERWSHLFEQLKAYL